MEFTNILNKFGDFWLVGKETQSFTGKLVEQDGSISLKCYIEWTIFKDTDEVSPFTINGNVGGQKVTLFSAYCVNRKSDMHSTKCNALFTPSGVVFGSHYSDENFCLIKMEAHYTDLENWFMFCVFEPTDGNNSDIVKFVQPEAISVFDMQCQIYFHFGMLQNYESVKKLELINQITVEFVFNNPTTLLEARSKVFSLRNLLLYFAGENLECYDISFTDEYNSECIYHLNFQEKLKRNWQLPYLVIFPDIKDSFQEIWTAWILFEENHEPLNNLFFEIISNHSRWSNKFLNLMQAIEAYSRNSREKEAKSVFNKYHAKDPVKDKTLALKHRVVDILEYTNRVFLLNSTEIDALANKVSKTRNYYTHYDKEKAKQPLTLKDFGHVNRFLQTVIMVVVLMNIGVPESCIIEARKRLFLGTVLSGIKPYLKPDPD